MTKFYFLSCMICNFMPIFSVAIAIIIAQLQKLGKNILAAYAPYTRQQDRQWCEQVDGRLSIRAPTVTTLPSNILQILHNCTHSIFEYWAWLDHTLLTSTRQYIGGVVRRSVTFKTQLWLTPSSFLASFSGVCLIKFLLAAGRNDGIKLRIKSEVSNLFETLESILHNTQTS